MMEFLQLLAALGMGLQGFRDLISPRSSGNQGDAGREHVVPGGTPRDAGAPDPPVRTAAPCPGTSCPVTSLSRRWRGGSGQNGDSALRTISQSRIALDNAPETTRSNAENIGAELTSRKR